MNDETTSMRPDWWMPLSIVTRAASNVVGSVAGGLVNLANVFALYSAYADERLVFQEQASHEIETLTEEGTDG